MTAVALTAAQIAPVFPDSPLTEIIPMVAGATITKGQVVCVTIATGLLDVADANGAGNLVQARGIALNAAAAGQPVSVLRKGFVYGFTVSGLAYDSIVYLSDTVGSLDTSAGSTTVQCGRVMMLSDYPTLTKVLYVDFLWRGPNWA